MATAVLHDEFTPYSGRGGVCVANTRSEWCLFL